MFLPLFHALRAAGLPVGPAEHLALLDAVAQGVIGDIDALYTIGRAILCRSEADFDAWDQGFARTFKDAAIDPAMREKLERWLAEKAQREGALVDPTMGDRELWEELLKRLQEQKEAHHGGNHWIGTGGTSPFGHSGRASRGIRVGGEGGNRGAISVAEARSWADYRTDTTLDVRDYQLALRTLRRLQREGRWELDLDATIDRTSRNAGDIEIAMRRERENQVRLVLLMDAGGSMAPHAQKVEQLFSAADAMRSFRSFEFYFFHNCVYGRVWRELATNDAIPTADLLSSLTHRHRLLFVGDASMAPYELFSAVGWGWAEDERVPGIEWLRLLKARCPASAWLNPDPMRWWDHPTVSAIGQIFPMHELTVDGMRRAIVKLRAPT